LQDDWNWQLAWPGRDYNGPGWAEKILVEIGTGLGWIDKFWPVQTSNSHLTCDVHEVFM